MKREDLHEYQHRAVDWIIRKGRSGLFLDMGLGKTVVTLTAVSDLLDICEIRQVLVIAPLRVANSVWKQEAALWEHLRHLRVSICTGHEKGRKEALERSADVYVINRENVVWLVNYFGKDWPFDFVVVDESSSFKSPSSKRTRALRKVSKLYKGCVLLTGTPSPNGLLDLWSQIRLIDHGERLGTTYGGYKDRFFESDYMGYNWTPKPGADGKIYGSIGDVVMGLRAEDYLQVPSRVDLFERVLLPDKTLDDYKRFEKDLFIEFEDAELDPMNAATVANKLLQWCNGAVYIEDRVKHLHDAKLDALAEIVEENEWVNILVAYNYRHDLDRLKKRFPFAVELNKSQKTIDDWNAGKIRMLLAHPASAGHGLNLQRGGSMIVWFGLNWNLELYQQMNARLHRQGQTRPVRVVHLIAECCIDEVVMGVLKSKDKTQDALLNALKACRASP